MSAATFTKSGTKATAAAKLDKSVFAVDVKNHELLKQAYLSYLAEKRNSHATAKTRGLVRGGGRKPWRQKGTGNARVGSTRSPIWRGGGITFGPTGNENHVLKLSTQSKRLALRQALSLAAQENRITVIEGLSIKDTKTKNAALLLKKIDAKGAILLVVNEKDELLARAIKNVPNVSLISAKYLSVFSVMNADSIVMTSEALGAVHEWLKVAVKKEAKT